MNENDLRDAMRTTLTLSAEPPPMDSATAVSAGRRAVRRRTTLAGAGATAVLVAAVLAIAPGQRLFAGGGQPFAPAGQAGANPSPTPTSPGEKTAPSWPIDGNGEPQEDATARSGARYEQGKRVLEGLLAVVPEGYTTPTGDASDGTPLQDHQAAVDSAAAGSAWGYLASAAIAKDKGTGRLLAEVHTAGNKLPTDPCELAREFWGMGGDCRVETVGTAKVGVVVKPGADDRLGQWAAYRHPDGIVVFVAQARNVANIDSSVTPLAQLPLSVPELAALTVDERFHLK